MIFLVNIALPGAQTALAIAGIFLLIVALIVFFRVKFSRTENIEATSSKSVLKNRNKYEQVNAFGFSFPMLLFGCVCSFLITILAFNWTSYEEEVFIPEDALEMEEDILQAPPPTAEPPPPPPPPPPPVIEEVPEEEIEEEDEPVFEDQEIDVETEIEAPEPVVEEAPPPPPPPPPPPEPEVEEIFQVVEEMPRFPGCENKAEAERKACADKKMLEFIYKNIKYPPIARENGVEGTVVVTFVVEKDGSVTDARILRDIGAQCGSEGLRVVQMMNNMSQKWSPGKQRGKPVRVQFNLPIKFRLE